MDGTSVTVGIPTFNRARLLGAAIESVLAQTYRDFRLIVSDNASSDETHEVVASFSDARIEYVRADKNIGMIGNFNRVLELTETEFVMLLPDDDRLYPDYLRSVVEILQRNPRVGLIHTAFDEIDIDSRVQKYAASYVKSSYPLMVEPGRAFLERSMTSTAVLLSSTTYRTHAIREAGGMTARDEPFADVPLFMRIAQNWDIAYLDRPLVAFRVHDQTETTLLASRSQDEPDARDRLLTYGRIMFDRRMGFLDDAGLPSGETNRYRSLATLRFLADRAGLGAPWLQTWAGFVRIVRLYPRILTHPLALRLIAAQFGGRALRRAASRLASLVLELIPDHVGREKRVVAREPEPSDVDRNSSIRTHLIVTPARNEAENLQRLGESLIEQTWRPDAWIVVDNGSTDGTQDVVRELGRVHNWIRLVSIPSDASPARGRSSVRAFNAGVMGELTHADLVTGLDADVSFGPDYLDSLRREFQRNPRLGIASGLCYEPSGNGDGWEPVHVTHPNLRGASLTYRLECLAQLLPLEVRLGWEGIGVVRARVRGWETAIIPNLRYFHHRPTGARDVSRFSSYAEDGDTAYYMWYRPSYMLLRTLYRAIGGRDPAAAGLAWGYARSALNRRSRHPEAGFREFIRSNQSPTNWLFRAREVTGKR